MKTTNSIIFSDGKPHYEILDGLRGVAALLVLWYHVRGAFAMCSVVLLLIFLVPNITSEGAISLNGVYEFCCISLLFPCIVTIGASATINGKYASRLCSYLGNISFPLYITHYPVMYLFYAWMINTGLCTLADTWQVTIGVCLWNVLFATICMKFYDIPVRKMLARKL